MGEDQRHTAENGGDHRHHHRPQADRAGLFDGDTHALAMVAKLVGEFDDQDAVLRHDPDQQHEADLAIDIEARSGQHQRKDGAGQPQRHRRHDDDRAQHAFELRRQHQKDDGDGEAEGQQHAGGIVLQRRRLRQRQDARPRRQQRRGDALCFGQCVAKRQPRRQVGGDRHRRQLLLAGQLRRDGAFIERGDGCHRHDLAVAGLDEQIFEIGRIVDRPCIGGQKHRIGLAVHIDVDHRAAVEQRLDGGGQAGDVDAHVGGALAVDGDRKLGLRRLIGQARLAEAGVLVHRLHDLLRSGCQLLVVAAENGELQAAAGAANAQAVGLDDVDAQTRHPRRGGIDVGDDVVLAALARIPGGQRQHHEAVIRLVVHARDRIDVADFARSAQRLQPFLHALHLVLRIGEADALRRRHPQHDHGAVLARGQFAGHHGEGQHRRDSEHSTDGDHHHRRVEAGAQQAQIDVGEPIPDPAENAMMLDHLLGQHARGEHGTERQRHDRRQADGKGEHEAEFAKQPAHLPRQEGQRNEDSRQRRRRRDHREEDLARAENGCGARLQSLPAPPHDVFQHHDGVIDHEPGRQHDGEQRQDVDRKPHQIGGGDRADQRHRHGDRRNDRRPPIAQEEIDDDHDDDRREDQRQLHLMDRTLDEGGVIAGNGDMDALRHGGGEFVDGGAHAG